jgi:hypothetical protein
MTLDEFRATRVFSPDVRNLIPLDNTCAPPGPLPGWIYRGAIPIVLLDRDGNARVVQPPAVQCFMAFEDEDFALISSNLAQLEEHLLDRSEWQSI